MVRRLNLTNKNSNDIYTLLFPNNLLGFIRFDFTAFMERSTDLCRLYMKTGAYKHEEVLEVRNSVMGCHKFVEQNIRGLFDKIVVDCWIEYICRLNEIGTVTLWNNFIPCRTDFEKAIFARLSEYRHNQAINQWVNVLKIQEYAKTKLDFVFGHPLKNLPEAATKANYFDLMFNVAANELGYDVGEIAENKVYSLGRTPNSPFIMSSVSREIVRSMFSDLKYFDETKHKPKKGEFIADQTAMDAFSAIKAYIPSENDLALGTMIKAMNESPQKVYIPESFKAVIDLEIDAVIESEAILQRCGRCREYFLRCEDYDYEYCDRVNREGKSCIEIMNGSGVASKKEKPVDAAFLSMRCDQLYREMSARVNVDLTQRDFSDWYKYMMLIRDNVLNGEATLEDFDNFVEYSHAMVFIPQHNKEKSEDLGRNQSSEPAPQRDKQGREIKPFVFEKIDRRELEEQNNALPDIDFPVKKRNRTEHHDEYVSYPYQQTETVHSQPQFQRVIRGTSDSADVYENRFDDVYNRAGSSASNERTAVQSPIDSVLAGNSFGGDIEEDDIKIYNVKPPKPEPKREFVKVFEPSKKKRSGYGTAPAPLSPPPSSIESRAPESRPEKLDNFLQNSSAAAEREQLEKVQREAETKPESRVSYAANAYRSTGSNPQEYGNKPAAYQNKNTNKSNTQETTPAGGQEGDFASTLLKGIERKDGFAEAEIPTDSEGMPLSHKTKRVMDAIFKPSKPSLFININRDE